MGQQEDFTVTKVAWSTKRVGMNVTREEVIGRFSLLSRFLNDHKLVTHVLEVDPTKIDDNYAIKRSDLTDRGFELMQTGYQQWIKSIDKGKSAAESLPILSKSLDKMSG